MMMAEGFCRGGGGCRGRRNVQREVLRRLRRLHHLAIECRERPVAPHVALLGRLVRRERNAHHPAEEHEDHEDRGGERPEQCELGAALLILAALGVGHLRRGAPLGFQHHRVHVLELGKLDRPRRVGVHHVEERRRRQRVGVLEDRAQLALRRKVVRVHLAVVELHLDLAVVQARDDGALPVNVVVHALIRLECRVPVEGVLDPLGVDAERLLPQLRCVALVQLRLDDGGGHVHGHAGDLQKSATRALQRYHGTWLCTATAVSNDFRRRRAEVEGVLRLDTRFRRMADSG